MDIKGDFVTDSESGFKFGTKQAKNPFNETFNGKAFNKKTFDGETFNEKTFDGETFDEKTFDGENIEQPKKKTEKNSKKPAGSTPRQRRQLFNGNTRPASFYRQTI